MCNYLLQLFFLFRSPISTMKTRFIIKEHLVKIYIRVRLRPNVSRSKQQWSGNSDGGGTPLTLEMASAVTLIGVVKHEGAFSVVSKE